MNAHKSPPSRSELEAQIASLNAALCAAAGSVEELKLQRQSLMAINHTLRDALELTIATIQRLYPKYDQPFSSVKGTLDVATAAFRFPEA